MSPSTHLYFTTALLLLVLSAATVQAQEAQAVMCRPCAIAQERCSVNCLGREGKAIGSCLIGCDNWSSFSDCGDEFCGAAFGCGECNEGQCEAYGPAMRQLRERYRVCFNPQGQPCTEYQLTATTLGCGC
jgi:hypothetical protein